MTLPWTQPVLDFWFGEAKGKWWRGPPEFDAQIRGRFEELWHRERHRTSGELLGSPKDALAAVILFDQFPRNMFRDHADQFSTDPLALAVAKGAVAKGYDDGMTAEERTFLYLPFEHSENIADQRQSLLLFAALGDPELLRFARLHHDIIERFGRFPHRNAILGRKPTAIEAAAGDVVPW